MRTIWKIWGTPAAWEMLVAQLLGIPCGSRRQILGTWPGRLAAGMLGARYLLCSLCNVDVCGASCFFKAQGWQLLSCFCPHCCPSPKMTPSRSVGI